MAINSLCRRSSFDGHYERIREQGQMRRIFSRDAPGVALAFSLPLFCQVQLASAVTGAKLAASNVRHN